MEERNSGRDCGKFRLGGNDIGKDDWNFKFGSLGSGKDRLRKI